LLPRGLRAPLSWPHPPSLHDALPIYDATALAVQNKQVDAGAVDSAIYNQLVDSGKVDGDQIKTIWKSEKLFQYPWAVHENTDEEDRKSTRLNSSHVKTSYAAFCLRNK